MDRKVPPVSIKHFLFLLVTVVLLKSLAPMPVHAADLPLAAGSPLAGFAFDDRPLLLPVQRNFQMAMLTAGSELGRSCGKMEAYGWRMSASEQQRVNQIFSNTVERLRGLGYSIEAQAPTSVSHDITMFTADRPDRHFLFMWSAGEIGLVMTLCETSSPVKATHRAPMVSQSSVQTYPQDVVQSKLARIEAPARGAIRAQPTGKFNPIGNWVGGYTCAQGYTGATLQIAHLRNNNFDGTFAFYPTKKNRYAPLGRYAVYGQYDPGSQRILINPGKWIRHPNGYYNTVMVGSFDAMANTLSAYFQGINGCTSFEAKYASGRPLERTVIKKKHVKKPAPKKSSQKTAPMPAAAQAPAGTSTPTDAGGSIVLPPTNAAPEAVPAPAAAPAAPPTPAAPEPAVPALAPAPTPTAPAPALPPVEPTAPAPAPAGTSAPAPGKSGSIDPLYKSIVVASGEWFTPTVPQVQPPIMVNPPAQVPGPTITNPQAPPAQYPVPASPPIAAAPEPVIDPLPQQVQPPLEALPPPTWDHKASDAPNPVIDDWRAPPAQIPQMVPDPGHQQ